MSETSSRYQAFHEKATKVREEMAEFLDRSGFERGVQGKCNHKRGIPFTPNVLVRPVVCQTPQATESIMVTPTSAVTLMVKEPYRENKWQITGVYGYKTKEELKTVLNDLVFLNLGDWQQQVEEDDNGENNEATLPAIGAGG